MKLPNAASILVITAGATSAQQVKPKLHWGLDISEHGTMGEGNGIAVSGDNLFVSNNDCSLVVMNRVTPEVLAVHKFSDPAYPGDELTCSTVPVVFNNEFVSYGSNKGHVIAVNFDGAPKWNATVGTGAVQNVQRGRLSARLLVAHNEGPDGTITFLRDDGTIDEALGRSITNDTITGLSLHGLDGQPGSSLGDVHFFTGKTTAQLYRLTLGRSFPDNPDDVVVESTFQLGEPALSGDSPRYPPAIYMQTNNPIVKHFAPAADGHLYAFLTDYNAYDFRKKDPESSDGSQFGSPPLPAERVGYPSSAEVDMICFGRLSYYCVNANTGCPMWSRISIKGAISGDPDLFVNKDASQGQQTILLDDLRTGTIKSLDPMTGEDVWVLECGDYTEVGLSCPGANMAEGRGASAVSPDNDVAYFSPVRGWVVASEIFVPAEEPAPTAAPVANPPTAPGPPGATPTPAPTTEGGGTPGTDAPTGVPSQEPTEVPSTAFGLGVSFSLLLALVMMPALF